MISKKPAKYLGVRVWGGVCMPHSGKINKFKPPFATPICPFRNNWNDSFFDANSSNMFLDRVMFCNPIGECYPFHTNIYPIEEKCRTAYSGTPFIFSLYSKLVI